MKSISIEYFKRVSSLQFDLLLRLGIANFIAYRNPFKKVVKLSLSGFDIRVRKKTHDLEVALSCFDGEFDEAMNLLPENFSGLIVDAGGYIGTAALVFSRRFPNATVITIEPSEDNISILRDNVCGFSNIKIVEAALVGAASGPVQLLNRNSGEWGYSIVDSLPELANCENDSRAVIQSCPTTTLGQLGVSMDDIGLIKIDIEGGEYELLENDSENLSKIEILVIELHDRFKAGCYEKFIEFSGDRNVKKLDGEKFISTKYA